MGKQRDQVSAWLSKVEDDSDDTDADPDRLFNMTWKVKVIMMTVQLLEIQVDEFR